MNKKKCFIRTSDSGVAMELRRAGYPELARDGKFFVFVNDGRKMDAVFDKADVMFTDILNV